jgi:hypothetical protein
MQSIEQHTESLNLFYSTYISSTLMAVDPRRCTITWFDPLSGRSCSRERDRTPPPRIAPPPHNHSDRPPCTSQSGSVRPAAGLNRTPPRCLVRRTAQPRESSSRRGRPARRTDRRRVWRGRPLGRRVVDRTTGPRRQGRFGEGAAAEVRGTPEPNPRRNPHNRHCRRTMGREGGGRVERREEAGGAAEPEQTGSVAVAGAGGAVQERGSAVAAAAAAGIAAEMEERWAPQRGRDPR